MNNSASPTTARRSSNVYKGFVDKAVDGWNHIIADYYTKITAIIERWDSELSSSNGVSQHLSH